MANQGKRKVDSEKLWFMGSVVVGAAACLFLGFLVGQYMIRAVTMSVQEPQVVFDDPTFSDEVQRALEEEETKLIRQAEAARNQSASSPSVPGDAPVGPDRS